MPIKNFQGEGFLTGWRLIAAFIGVCIPTAMKYHTSWGMPVHHLPGGMVSALPHELRIWLIPRDKEYLIRAEHRAKKTPVKRRKKRTHN